MSDQTENSRLPVWKVSKEQQEQKEKNRKKRILWIAIIVAAAIFASVFLIRTFYVYSAYTTLTSVERMDTEASRFVPFGEDIIRYSNDGVSLTDVENNVQWSQSFEMQYPIITTRGDYAAVADRGGKTIFLMHHQDGFQARIATDLPIVKVDVDRRGNVAVLMKESDVNYLGMYNISGTKTAEGAIHFESSGFPLDLSLSADGGMMAVSTLNIESGRVGTLLNFYRFAKEGQETGDTLVDSLTYEDTVIPRIHYLDNQTLIAYGDNKVVLIGGGTEPSEQKSIELTQEVKCLFYNDEYFGLLYATNQEGEGDSAEIYNLSGTKIRTISLDDTYLEAGFMENGETYFLDGSSCAIYRTSGRKKFEGSTDTVMHTILSTDRYGKYIFVREGKTDTIRLKLFS